MNESRQEAITRRPLVINGYQTPPLDIVTYHVHAEPIEPCRQGLRLGKTCSSLFSSSPVDLSASPGKGTILERCTPHHHSSSSIWATCRISATGTDLEQASLRIWRQLPLLLQIWVYTQHVVAAFQLRSVCKSTSHRLPLLEPVERSANVALDKAQEQGCFPLSMTSDTRIEPS